MCPRSRYNARLQCAFVLGQHSRYHICLYIHRYILGGSRLHEASAAQPFSYRFVSLRSFSLPSRPSCSSVARARGIKYNKDIQWELIGYLPIYRSLSAYCCVVPPVQRRYSGTGPMPWSVRNRLLPSFSVPLFCSPASFFSFFHRHWPDRDILWQNNIADHVFSGRNALPRPRYRCVRIALSNTVFYPAPRWVLNEPIPVRVFGYAAFSRQLERLTVRYATTTRSISVCEFTSQHSRSASYN